MPDADCRETPFEEKVERIVNERIRPALRLHDGDLFVREACDGKVRIAFTGACRSCPSAQITLEEVVERILKEELGEEFSEVGLVNETDDDLLDFARQLLGKNR